VRTGLFTSVLLLAASGAAAALPWSPPAQNPMTLSTLHEGPGDAAVPPPAGLQWWKFANHTHTRPYSPDAYTAVERRVAGAAAEGADCIAITDHNNNGACSDPLFVTMDGCHPMCGEEYAWYAFDGELNLLNIASGASIGGSTVEEVIASAQAAGATVVVNHPFITSEPWSYEDLHPGIQGIEVWTSALFAFSGGEQAIAWWNGFLQKGRMTFAIGGSDNHTDSPFSLRPCNHVLALSPEPDAIQDGFEAGRLTIAASPTGGRCCIWCDSDRDGTFEIPMGTNVTAQTPRQVRFRVEAHDCAGLLLSIITRSGVQPLRTIGEAALWTVEFDATIDAATKDYIRAEVRTGDEGQPMEAVTNPIYINYTPGDSDGDGLTDVEEMAIESDHYAADTDGDGVSDGFEAGYDGNPRDYHPFPGGGDMNLFSADTDTDGVRDGNELGLHADPLGGGGEIPVGGAPAAVLTLAVIIACFPRRAGRANAR